MTDLDLKRLEQSIRSGLAGADFSPVWGAVMHALDYHLQERELPAALMADQSAEQRAYNNGRAAMLIDFRTFLEGKAAQARSSAETTG